MSLTRIFDIAGSAMAAQNTRLNTTASNMANSATVASSPEEAYKAKKPVFQAIMNQAITGEVKNQGVRVAAIAESRAPAPALYRPEHPLADDKGYVYGSNVNPVEEMAEMISAQRSYENSIEVLETAREMMLKTLRMGQ